jgi:hypothetical protein
LRRIRIFRQRGSRLCAHLSSADRIPSTQVDLPDLGADSDQVLRTLHDAGVNEATGSFCPSVNNSGALSREFRSFLSNASDVWLRTSPRSIMKDTPHFKFPAALFQDVAESTGLPVQQPAELFIGLCDLPEMMILRCANVVLSKLMVDSE